MVKSCGVLYGASKTFKTWNFGLLAKYIYEKTGKPSLLITADGGGYKPIQKFVDAEIIIPLSITNDPSRLSLMRKIVEGYWPDNIDNEGIRQGKTMTKVSPNMVGGYLFEGITSIAESIHSLYRGKKTGMAAAFTENVQSDLVDSTGKPMTNVTVGGLSLDSYGLVQGEMKYLLNFSWTLPAEFIWWSGHEASAEDDITRKVVRGVALVGQAATPRIGKDIGYMVHTYKMETGEILVNGKKEKTYETRYYFQSHPDNLLQNVFWEASSRLAGDQIPELLEKYKGGYFVPSYTSGLDEYLRTEDNLVAKGTNDVLAWKEAIDNKANTK